MIGIYKIVNKKNGKVYIGKSVDIENRWKKHVADLNNNNHCNKYLQDDWNIYGMESFNFAIVKKCRSNILAELEGLTIKEYDSYNKSKGYNIAYVACKNPYNAKNGRPNDFFMDEYGHIKYNEKCENCSNPCKQSHRVIIDYCPICQKS